MPKPRAIIQLTMSRLIVARCRGERVEDARAHELNAPNYKDRWPGILAELHEPLLRMLADLRLVGCDAVLLYHAPGASAGVFNCPAGGSAHASASAARLQIAESVTVPDAISDAQVLATDASSGNAREAPQRHTLAVLDSGQSVEALASWLTSAGLNVTQCLPVDAPALALSVRSVMRPNAEGSASATIWIGEHTTIMAAGVGGVLRFIRTVAIGTETLSEAITRSLRSGAGDDTQITLDRCSARAILAASGIPLPGQIIDSARGIEGTAVLPLLQPVLQRLAVEVKQSFRFGLSEGERVNLRIVLDGPGAGFARLAESVAQLTGLNISSEHAMGNMVGLTFAHSPAHVPALRPAAPTPAEAPGQAKDQNESQTKGRTKGPSKGQTKGQKADQSPGPSPVSVGEQSPSCVSGIITAWPGLVGLGLGLVSEETQQQRRQLGVRRGLRMGYLAAGALLCMSWFWTSLQLSQTRAITEDLATRAVDADRLTRQREQLGSATAAMRALEDRVARHSSPTSDFAVLLAEIASATPEHVRLSRIEVLPGEKHATLRLTGRISTKPDRPFAQAMRTFADTLGTIPLVLDARLGATSRVPFNESPVGEEHRFELSLSLAPLSGLNISGTFAGDDRARAIAEVRP